MMNKLDALRERMSYAKISISIIMSFKAKNVKEIDICNSEEDIMRCTVPFTESLHDHLLNILRAEYDAAREELDDLVEKSFEKDPDIDGLFRQWSE